MAALPDNCINLSVTSPPYDGLRRYNGFVFPFGRIAQQLYRVTKPGGVVVWVVGDETKDGSESGNSFRQVLYFMGLGFNLHDTMIYQWDKPPLTHNRYEQKFEYMFILSKGKPAVFNPIMEPTKHAGQKQSMKGRAASFGQGAAVRKSQTRNHIVTSDKTIRGNIWFYLAGRTQPDSERYIFNHPAIFPEALAHDHILSWSNPGDIVFDPMIGSGTVAKMAVVTGRQYLGFEISQEYCDLARRRVGEVEREQRKEWKPLRDNGNLDDLPLFTGIED